MKRFFPELRSLTTEAYLWAQRSDWPVPSGLRRRLRNVMVDAGGSQEPVELDHWAMPLLGPRAERKVDHDIPSITRMQLQAASNISTAWPLSTERQQPRFKCAVVNGVAGIGGLDKVARALAQHLPCHGFETVLVVGEGQAASQLHDLDPSIEVVELGPETIGGWLDSYRPDVISGHSPSDWLVHAAHKSGIPVVETLHGAHTFFGTTHQIAERQRNKYVKTLVAVSELVRRQYLRAIPERDPRSIVTIPNGTAAQAHDDAGRDQLRASYGLRDEFLFVSLARYCLQKNSYGLVEAFDAFAREHDNVHLLIAGPVEDLHYCRQVLHARKHAACSDRIHLRGNCDDIGALLAAADGFVLNSFFEGWALASMEALVAGLPIVMSEVGGAREQIGEDGTRGIVVNNPLGDPELLDWDTMSRARFRPQVNRQQLIQAMRAVAAQSEHWSGLRATIRQDALARFSIERFVAGHANVLLDAITPQPDASSARPLLVSEGT